jgi:hypothetical protein
MLHCMNALGCETKEVSEECSGNGVACISKLMSGFGPDSSDSA